ncbi:sigma-70 family RNA polymerase sigma factor [Paludisphaera soli]|uniref:sigma-70 family RNA polymerase sigma factor n=1 Tax=Paludisphaera soli TaxID=2712865 RepID=UPI0013EBC203|nr:sigma-70 family RNA polymerase sigma factor [Paludisphaera soli]
MEVGTPNLGSRGARTDRSLLERVRSRDDHEAWAAFLAEYVPRIRAWCRRPGLGEEAVDELIQRVLVRLASRMRSFAYDPSKTFRGWLRRVVGNEVCDYLREAGAAARPLPPEYDPPAPAAATFGLLDDEPDHPLFERARAIQKAVRAGVSETTWAVFRRCAIDDEPMAEVARDLGMSFAAVYMAVRRVGRKLAEQGRRELDRPGR